MSIFTSVIKCGICGEPLSGAGNPYTCAVCGNVSYTSNPMLEDELRTANAMRECTRFDEAMLVYKQIVKKYKTDDLSEVYWNLLLCEQRVMFETDEKGERFPSFYAIVSDDVEDSPYYTCALSAAGKHAPERVAIFTEMAEKMARAKQLYARIRESEKPYDVFICFKKSKLDGSGEETPDTDLAEDLYNQFAKDYRIFFSERTLRDVAVRDFEPNIYYALYTAKVLLLLCSKREYIDSKWVKNEWSRYHAMAQNPATGKTVIPVFLEDFEPGNLPAELLSYQGLADGRQLMGALESTLRKILKPLDMEAELNRRMQEMLAEQRRREEEQRQREAEQRQRMEEQQRQMQEQLEAMRKAQEQMEAMRKAQEQPKPAAPAPTIPTPTPQPAIPTPKPATPSPAAPKAATAPATKSTSAPEFEIENGVLKKYTGSLLDVVIPGGVSVIGEKVFASKGITNIKIPASVTRIAAKAFSNCSDLFHVKIAEGSRLQNVASDAFEYCEKLIEIHNGSSLEIKAGATSYGGIATYAKCVHNSETAKSHIFVHDKKFVFYDDGSFRSLLWYMGLDKAPILPADCNGHPYEIASHAFADLGYLTSVTLSKGVTAIGSSAFWKCTSLTSFEIPNSVKAVGRYAFGFCEKLEKIVIPSSVTSLGESMLCWCESLRVVDNQASVGKIPNSFYNGCTKLTHIKIPPMVLEVEKDVFNACRSLEVIEFPPMTLSLGYNALSGCYALKEIYCHKALKGDLKERMKQDLLEKQKVKIHFIK